MILTLLFLIPFSISTTPSSVIIEVWGTVDDFTSSEEYSGTWMDCMSRCYWEPSCVVILNTDSGCQLYRFRNVSSVTVSDRTSGKELGIKKLLSTCPRDIATALEDSVETYQTDEIAYQYTINSTEVGVSRKLEFTYHYYFQCPSGSMTSIRGEHQVCITTRDFTGYNCQNREQGVALCEKSGDVGLTGPYSKEEGASISNRLSSRNTPYTYVNYWIDGYINNSFVTVTDGTLNGTAGYDFFCVKPPLAADQCPYLGTKGSDAAKYVRVVTCTSPGNKQFCQRGALCRTEPIYEF